jgi:hypothetical protein
VAYLDVRGPLACGCEQTPKPFNDICWSAKLKIMADLIEPRSVVRANTTEFGEGGKDFVSKSRRRFLHRASRTTTGADPRRGPSQRMRTTSAPTRTFRSRCWLPAVIGNVTATRTDTQWLITADASHLPHDPGWVHKRAKWIADQPAANVLERQPEADVLTVVGSLLGP